MQKDAEWYLKNLDQIAAFEKWIEVVKSAVPKQIANLVKTAANAAIIELNANQELDGGYELESESHTDGSDNYWFLPESFHDDIPRRGAVISAWIPRSIEWLTSEGDDLPTLGLYFHGPKNRLEEYGRKVSEAVGPSRDYKRINKINGGVFFCMHRVLNNELSVSSFLETKRLETDLTKIFMEFTVAVRPGLDHARTLLAPGPAPRRRPSRS